MKNDVVSSAVWRWREKAEGERPASRETSRRAAEASPAKIATQTVIAAVVGALFFFWWKRPLPAYIVWGIAGALLVCGLFFPSAFAAVGRAGKWLGRQVGTAMTWGLLTPFYYVCFSPMRAIMKLRGKDPPQRKFDPSATSYWTERKPVKNTEQYKKQF